MRLGVDRPEQGARPKQVPLTRFVSTSRWVEDYAASLLVASSRSRAVPSRAGFLQAIKRTLGRAQRYYGVRVVACVFLSNHFHLLLLPHSEKQLADFMRFVKTNLSKQLGRIHGWSGPMLKRRYQARKTANEE